MSIIEYKILVLSSNSNAITDEKELNQLGDQGWELVGVTALPDYTVRAYFKRPKQECEKKTE